MKNGFVLFSKNQAFMLVDVSTRTNVNIKLVEQPLETLKDRDFILRGTNCFCYTNSLKQFQKRTNLYKSITNSIGLLASCGFCFKHRGNGTIRVEKQGVLFATLYNSPNIFSVRKTDKVLQKLCMRHCKP